MKSPLSIDYNTGWVKPIMIARHSPKKSIRKKRRKDATILN